MISSWSDHIRPGINKTRYKRNQFLKAQLQKLALGSAETQVNSHCNWNSEYRRYEQKQLAKSKVWQPLFSSSLLVEITILLSRPRGSVNSRPLSSYQYTVGLFIIPIHCNIDRAAVETNGLYQNVIEPKSTWLATFYWNKSMTTRPQNSS